MKRSVRWLVKTGGKNVCFGCPRMLYIYGQIGYVENVYIFILQKNNSINESISESPSQGREYFFKKPLALCWKTLEMIGPMAQQPIFQVCLSFDPIPKCIFLNGRASGNEHIIDCLPDGKMVIIAFLRIVIIELFYCCHAGTNISLLIVETNTMFFFTIGAIHIWTISIPMKHTCLGSYVQ